MCSKTQRFILSFTALLATMIFSSAAMADLAPTPRTSCNDCFNCYRCDSKSWAGHVPKTDCSQCSHLQCNYADRCAQIAPFPSVHCRDCFDYYNCNTKQWEIDRTPEGRRGWKCGNTSGSDCNYEAVCGNQPKAPKDDPVQLPEPELKDIESEAGTTGELKIIQEANNPEPEVTHPAPEATAPSNPAPEAVNSAPESTKQENTKRKSSCSSLTQNGDNAFSLAIILAAILALISLLGIALLRTKDSKQ